MFPSVFPPLIHYDYVVLFRRFPRRDCMSFLVARHGTGFVLGNGDGLLRRAPHSYNRPDTSVAPAHFAKHRPFLLEVKLDRFDTTGAIQDQF